MIDATRASIDRLFAQQHGTATRTQLRAAGLSSATIRRRIGDGRYTVVGAKTVQTASSPSTPRSQVAAACLDAGAVASHWTAAWLHGLAERPPVIHVTVRKGRRMGAPEVQTGTVAPVRIHSSTNLPAEDIIVVDGIRVTSVARTMLGVAALVPAELNAAGLAQLVGKAVDENQATDGWLWWLLGRRRCRGRNGVTALEDVLATRARLGPTESWLEREVLRILEAAGVPLPATQRVIRRSGRFAARVDFQFEPFPIVLEALGYAFHRTPEQMAADLARANELQLEGFEVYQFTTSQIVGSPNLLVHTVTEALARRGPGPRRF